MSVGPFEDQFTHSHKHVYIWDRQFHHKDGTKIYSEEKGHRLAFELEVNLCLPLRTFIQHLLHFSTRSRSSLHCSCSHHIIPLCCAWALESLRATAAKLSLSWESAQPFCTADLKAKLLCVRVPTNRPQNLTSKNLHPHLIYPLKINVYVPLKWPWMSWPSSLAMYPLSVFWLKVSEKS